jgi:hypothetical protein
MQPQRDDRVTFTGKLTMQDAINLHWYRERCLIRPGIRFSMNLLAVGLVCGAGFSFLHAGINTPGIFLIAVSICILGNGVMNRWFLQKRYKRNPDDFVETTVSISPVEIHLNNKNIDMTLPWTQVASVCDTPKGLLFLVRDSAPLCWLPQRLFEGNQSKEQILQYAKAATTQIKTYS